MGDKRNAMFPRQNTVSSLSFEAQSFSPPAIVGPFSKDKTLNQTRALCARRKAVAVVAPLGK
jgi:hypothetical protein